MNATEILKAITAHFDNEGHALNGTSPLVVAAREVVDATPGDAVRPLVDVRAGLSPAELERRRATLGSSEIAAVAGVNPYATEHDVWASKCLGVDFEGNEATHLGNLLEPTIFGIYADRYGKKLVRGEYTLGPEPWMSCTPDARIVGEDGLVEAKLVGLRSLYQWGPGNTDAEESDAVPMHYLCQAIWQMAVTGAAFVDVSALLGTEFRTYRIRRNLDLERQLIERGRAFWNDHVVPRIPPPVDGSDGASQMLRKLYPRDGADPLEADAHLEELARQLVEARDAESSAKEAKRLRENQIKSVLKDARGAFGNGWRIRYAETRAGTRPFVFEIEKETKAA
jgi:putative phage-type endonuclease